MYLSRPAVAIRFFDWICGFSAMLKTWELCAINSFRIRSGFRMSQNRIVPLSPAVTKTSCNLDSMQNWMSKRKQHFIRTLICLAKIQASNWIVRIATINENYFANEQKNNKPVRETRDRIGISKIVKPYGCIFWAAYH